MQASIPQLWHQFLIDALFAQRYELGYIDDPCPGKNPVLERLLPSLLHVKAVAILDHALRDWCKERGVQVPRKAYGRDLKGRIAFLVDNKYLSDGAALQAIRDLRNELAHQPVASINWARLDVDVRAIHSALHQLGIVGIYPNWTIGASRSAAQPPRIPDALMTFDYNVTIREGESPVGEISWSTHTMRAGK